MKKNNSLLKLAILSIALVSQANTIASVMLADIAKSFPNASQTALQYVMQMGMIGAFPISLIAGFLANKIRKKSLVMTGLCMIVLGGLIPIINHSSIMILYIGALIVGGGQGFLMPLLGALIIEHFEGSDQHAMMGYNTAASSLGATVLLLIAGFICKTGWVNVYYLYFLALPVLIIVLAFLPKAPPKTPETLAEKEVAATAHSKSPIPAKGWVQCILNGLLFMVFSTFPINISLYIDAKGLGDAATTSLAMALVTGFGILAGLLFKHILKYVKLYISTFAALCGTIGMLLTCIAPNMIVIYIATLMLGLFFGCSNSGGMYLVSRICTPEQVGPTFSISMSLVTVGVIISPIVINNITSLWGGVGSLGSFITSTILFIIFTILSIFWNTYLTKTLPIEG